MRRLDGGEEEIGDQEGRADDEQGQKDSDHTAPQPGRWDGQQRTPAQTMKTIELNLLGGGGMMGEW